MSAITQREIEEREACWNMTGGRCFYCGQNLRPDSDESQLSPNADFREVARFQRGRKPYWVLDHVMSRSRGGVDLAENYVPACDDCNTQKNRKTPKEYRHYLLKHGVNAVFFDGKPRDWLFVSSVPNGLTGISTARRHFASNPYR